MPPKKDSKSPPIVTLIDLKLQNVSCKQTGAPMRGTVDVENNVVLHLSEDVKEMFDISLRTVIKGFSADDKNASKEVFSAEAEWKGSFRLEKAYERSTIEKYAYFYSNMMYSAARLFIVETLQKMGINLALIPWEVNPKQ